MAESVTFTPSVKVRACVLGEYTDGLFFENMNTMLKNCQGQTSFDVNTKFYNPRGDRDSEEVYQYWALPYDQVSSKILSQFDVIYAYNDADIIGYEKILQNWIQNGGIFIVNDISKSHLYLNIFKQKQVSSFKLDEDLNYNATSYYYPFPKVGSTTVKDFTLGQMLDFSGFSYYYDSMFKAEDGYYGNFVVNFGKGKIICLGKSTDSTNLYKCHYNLIWSAISDNSSRQSEAKRPTGLTGIMSTDTYHGDKALIVGKQVFYVLGEKFYVDGFDLTDGANGTVPSEELSRPEHLGGSDFVMYDEKGNLYMCCIDYNEDKSIDSNKVMWYKLYSTNDIDCTNTKDFAPVVFNYWVYFLDNKGDLNCVWTKELHEGKAKYSWVTKGASLTNSVAKCAPVLSSRIDMYGSQVTEISWIGLNDSGATNLKYSLCSVPVAVVHECSRRQPSNLEPYNQIIPNYSGWPNLTGNNTIKIFDDDKTTPEVIFCNLGYEDEGEFIALSPYMKGETSEWDYKVNKSSKDAKRDGYIELNTVVTDGVTYFNTTCKTDKIKGKMPAAYDFYLSYVPKYTTALRSEVPFASGMFSFRQDLISNGNGVVYSVKKSSNNIDEDNASQDLNFVNKHNITENLRQGTFSRYAQWSYLPHAGFTNLKSPTSSSKVINAYSYIDWGFPAYTNATNVKVVLNGITSYNNNVLLNVTAIFGNIKRSAVICLDGNAEPEISIVDENRNPVALRYIQKDKKGTSRTVSHSAKIYQPSVYDTEIAYNDRVFNASSYDYYNGIIKVNNMANFAKKDGKSQMITTSLPAFVLFSYTLDQLSGSTEKTYIPIFPGTCPIADVSTYNQEIGDVTIPITDGSKNVDTKVYADMSKWNIIKWYAVLPGNTETFGKPLVSGDNVLVFAKEHDEYNKNSQNKSFIISLKGNIENGVKVRENDIKSASIDNNVNFNEKIQTSFSPEKVVVSNGNNVYAFENRKTLIVDGTTLQELDPSGNVAWRLSKVEYSNNKDKESSDYKTYDFTLENPIKAKYVFDNNHIAVADAGSKSIMVMDKTGWLKPADPENNTGNWWLFKSFDDPYGLLRAGTSLELGFISDFLFWTEENGNITNCHFMVADSTNKRVMDLVIYVNKDGKVINNNFINGMVVPQLNWVTYDNVQGAKNNYVSLDISEKILDRNGDEMRVVVCGIANYNVSERNGIRRAKGGSVAIYDYRMDANLTQNTNNATHIKRFGRLYDTIGKPGDGIYNTDTYDKTVGSYISGLKKVVIANLDGRNFNSGDIKDYDKLEVILCDDFGANLYYVADSEVKGNMFFYYWNYDTKRSISSKYFGHEHPNYDKYITNLASNIPNVMRFQPFSANYYSRNSYNNLYLTDYAPIKAPIVPIDVKVLSNGNWLILNGWTGELKYNYENPADGLLYTIEGKYYGEVIELGFKTIRETVNSEEVDVVYPEVIWTSNQFKSIAIDDYLTIYKSGSNWTGWSNEQLDNWNRVLDDMDIRVYSPQNSIIGYENNIIGGAKYTNKTLKSPRSLDR